jgi:prevent-host-death family protein
MIMIVVNINEAKAKLSEYLESVASGQRVLICKRNQPVAELRAVSAGRTEPRPVGLAKGQMVVPESFFDPLPDEVIDAFRARYAVTLERVETARESVEFKVPRILREPV